MAERAQDRAADRARAPDVPAPDVSVVMSVLNEARHLADATRYALEQDYRGPIEVVVALGPSTDGTHEVAAALAAADPRIRVIDNPDPRGATPAGLNAAIAAARSEVLVRVDGHSLLPRDYVRVAVETMHRTGAANVGGVMAAEGSTPFERAVARAMTTRLGVGSAPYHTGGSEGPAESVYLGVFRRSALLAAGGYDEAFVRAQDWELNHRMRERGELVWFQPGLHVAYRPRSTARALARQYFHYGRWRRVIMRRNPETASLRYLAPPAALVGVTVGVVAGVTVSRWAFAVPAGYVGGVVAGSVANARCDGPSGVVRLAIVYATMHASWGAGFLTSPRRLARTPSPS